MALTLAITDNPCRPIFDPTARTASGGAAGQRDIGRRSSPADHRRTHHSFYAASQRAFLDSFFRNVWRWRWIQGWHRPHCSEASRIATNVLTRSESLRVAFHYHEFLRVYH